MLRVCTKKRCCIMYENLFQTRIPSATRSDDRALNPDHTTPTNVQDTLLKFDPSKQWPQTPLKNEPLMPTRSILIRYVINLLNAIYRDRCYLDSSNPARKGESAEKTGDDSSCRHQDPAGTISAPGMRK